MTDNRHLILKWGFLSYHLCKLTLQTVRNSKWKGSHPTHESKYTGKEDEDVGDEQFEINDNRSFDRMYKDMEDGGLQPVVNEYIYV